MRPRAPYRPRPSRSSSSTTARGTGRSRWPRPPRAQDPRIRVFTKANGGEASALNVGFREARGNFIAIVEGDVEVAPDWLETCLAILEKEPDVFAAGGYLETPREDPWIARLAGYEVERKFATKPRDAKHLTSANVLYRREAWDLAGPFDERLVNASLDSVFNGRLAKAGKRLVYEPAARVRHHYKTTFCGVPPPPVRLRALPRPQRGARPLPRGSLAGPSRRDRGPRRRGARARRRRRWLSRETTARASRRRRADRCSSSSPSSSSCRRRVEVWRRTRDPVALVYPVVLVVRNVVGASATRSGSS